MGIWSIRFQHITPVVDGRNFTPLCLNSLQDAVPSSGRVVNKRIRGFRHQADLLAQRFVRFTKKLKKLQLLENF